MPHFWSNYGLILDSNVYFWALVFFSKNQILGGGADCPISQHLQYIKTLKFKKLTIPKFRAIFRLLKYPKINSEKTTPITDKQPLILKNTFWAKQTTPEFQAIFGLLKYPKIIFEKTTPITEKQPLILKNAFWGK